MIFQRALQCDLASHAWLNLICRSIKSIVEPHQYERITVDLEGKVGRRIPMALLPRTIVGRPEPGSCIRHLEIAGTWPDRLRTPNATSFVMRVRPHEQEILARRGAALNDALGPLEDWAEHLRIGLPDTYLVLLLSYCTHLLYLTYGSGLGSVERTGPWERPSHDSNP